MDDTRLEWMKHIIYKALNLVDDDIFTEFLEQNDNTNELELAKFLNDSPKDDYQMLLFYKTHYEEEIEEILRIPKKQASNDMINVEGEVESEHLGSSKEKQNGISNGIHISSDVEHNELDEKEGDDPFIEGNGISPEYTTIINRKTRWRTCLNMKNTSVGVENLTEEYVYFIRITKGYINAPSDLKHTFNFMPSQMQWGYMRGSFLESLLNLLKHVYAPLLKEQQSVLHESHQRQNRPIDYEHSTKPMNSDKKENLNVDLKNGQDEEKVLPETRDEFLINTRKFYRIVETTIHQLNSDIVLEVPDLDVTGEEDEIVKSSKFLIIEKTIISWNRQIRQTLDTLLEKTPDGTSPLNLIDYWRDRNLILGTLIEQLKRSPVVRFYHLHQLQENDAYTALYSEINSLYIQARDNVKFLSLLERHFKTLTFGNKFESIIDIIYPLMQTFHMIWVLSRYYNRDENMLQLFERTALTIVNRVVRAIDLPNLFHSDVKQSISLIKIAINLLNHWKSVYYQKRAEIETVGRDARWEFDKIKLNFYNNRRFSKYFGSELKSVTCDPKKIDEASKHVKNIIENFHEIRNDPFNKENKSWWDEELQKFHEVVQHLEHEANSLINDSFTLLRSSESAFDVWCKFRHIKTRPKIHDLLNEKFVDILKQYEKELENVNRIFNDGSVLPPFYDGHNTR
ncbi:unnamed protein product [Heterobilharzia americana]|nr:unnamed protein product [Heterobilharzia americana]